MSLIETMRNSGPSQQHQQAIGSVILLQQTLEKLNPTAEIQQAILEIKKLLAISGELIAKEVVSSTEALLEILRLAQDVASNLGTLIGQSEDQMQKSITALREATSALKLIQEPKPVPKDPLTQALPWLLLANMVISMVTLATVFLQA